MDIPLPDGNSSDEDEKKKRKPFSRNNNRDSRFRNNSRRGRPDRGSSPSKSKYRQQDKKRDFSNQKRRNYSDYHNNNSNNSYSKPQQYMSNYQRDNYGANQSRDYNSHDFRPTTDMYPVRDNIDCSVPQNFAPDMNAMNRPNMPNNYGYPCVNPMVTMPPPPPPPFCPPNMNPMLNMPPSNYQSPCMNMYNNNPNFGPPGEPVNQMGPGGGTSNYCYQETHSTNMPTGMSHGAPHASFMNYENSNPGMSALTLPPPFSNENFSTMRNIPRPPSPPKLADPTTLQTPAMVSSSAPLSEMPLSHVPLPVSFPPSVAVKSSQSQNSADSQVPASTVATYSKCEGKSDVYDPPASNLLGSKESTADDSELKHVQSETCESITGEDSNAKLTAVTESESKMSVDVEPESVKYNEEEADNSNQNVELVHSKKTKLEPKVNTVKVLESVKSESPDTLEGDILKEENANLKYIDNIVYDEVACSVKQEGVNEEKDQSCFLVSNITEEKVKEDTATADENLDAVKENTECVSEANPVKKLDTVSSVKDELQGRPGFSAEISVLNTASRKRLSLPCLGKEAAKKRLKAFSVNQIIVKDKDKAKKSNLLQDDSDEKNNDQTGESTEEKKEVMFKKKKKKEQKSVIEQIRDEEIRFKEVLFMNSDLLKPHGLTLSDLPGLYNSVGSLEKFEAISKKLKEMLETTKREESEKEKLDGAKEKRSSRSVSRDRETRRERKHVSDREKKYSRSESRDDELRARKNRKPKEPPKSWREMKELSISVDDLYSLYKNARRSRSRSSSFDREERRNKRSRSREKVAPKNDPFPYQPKHMNDLFAVNIEDYSTKTYRASNIQYTSTKPSISYCIDSFKYNHHYLSLRELKKKSSAEVFNQMLSLRSKSDNKKEAIMNSSDFTARNWYYEDWVEATKSKADVKLEKSEQKKGSALDYLSESYTSENVIFSRESKDESVMDPVVEKSSDLSLLSSALDKEYEAFMSTLQVEPPVASEEKRNPAATPSAECGESDEEEAESGEVDIQDSEEATEVESKETPQPKTIEEVKALLETLSLSKVERKELKRLKKVMKKEKEKEKAKRKALKKQKKIDKKEKREREKRERKEKKRLLKKESKIAKEKIPVEEDICEGCEDSTNVKVMDSYEVDDWKTYTEEERKTYTEEERKTYTEEERKTYTEEERKTYTEEENIEANFKYADEDTSLSRDNDTYTSNSESSGYFESNVLSHSSFDSESSLVSSQDREINSCSANSNYGSEPTTTSSANERYSPSNVSLYSEDAYDVDTKDTTMELASPSSLSPSHHSQDLQLSSECSKTLQNDSGAQSSPYSPSSPPSSIDVSPTHNGTLQSVNAIPMPPVTPSLESAEARQSTVERSKDNKRNIDKVVSDGMDNHGETLAQGLDASAEQKVSESGSIKKGFQPVVFKLTPVRQSGATKKLQRPSLPGFAFEEEEETTRSPLQELDESVSKLHRRIGFPVRDDEIQKKENRIASVQEKPLTSSRKNTEDETRKSPSPTNMHCQNQSPKESGKNAVSYEKFISKNLSSTDKGDKEVSPVTSSYSRKRERSRTPDNAKRYSKGASISERQKYNKSPHKDETKDGSKSYNKQDVADTFGRNVQHESSKKSRSRSPSPVSKWSRVRSTSPEKFRKLSSSQHGDSDKSHSYSRERSSHEQKSSHSSKKSLSSSYYSGDRSPDYERSVKHRSKKHGENDENYSSYEQDYSRPIDCISSQYQSSHSSNWDWASTPKDPTEQSLDAIGYLDESHLRDENSPQRLSLDERLKQEHGLEIDDDHLHIKEYVSENYWGYNSSQTPQENTGKARVIRVGNFLQVLPQDSPEKALPDVPQSTPGMVQTVISSSPVQSAPQIVQTGNVIQVVPTDSQCPDIPISDSNEGGTGQAYVMGSVTPSDIPLPGIVKSIEDTILPPSSAATVATPDPLAVISSLLAASLSQPVLKGDGSLPLSTYSYFMPDKTLNISKPVNETNSVNKQHSVQASAVCQSAAPPGQETLVEISARTTDPASIPNLDSQQQAILSAAVAAARGVTDASLPFSQLFSVLQQSHIASSDTSTAAVTSQGSVVVPMHEPAPAVFQNLVPDPQLDLETFKQQRRERKERKRQEREMRHKIRREKALQKKALESQEEEKKGDLSDEEDSVLKEAMTEVPELGSPVPEYEIYNEDEDDDEDEDEDRNKKNRFIPPVLPPPEKGILLSPSYRTLNSRKDKSVSFADGIFPGCGSDVSGGEEIHSPPPPNAEPEKKQKKLKKKKKVKVKAIKQCTLGNDRMDSPPPPPVAPASGETLKLYPGCTHYTLSAPGTFVVYVHQQDKHNGYCQDVVNGGISGSKDHVMIPAGMLFHSSSFSGGCPQEGNPTLLSDSSPQYQMYTYSDPSVSIPPM